MEFESNKNRMRIGTIAIVALLLVMGGFFWGINSVKCPTCIGTVSVIVTDSSAPAKDTGVIAINTQPKLKETRKYSPEASRKNGTLAGDFRKTKVVEFDHLCDSIITTNPTVKESLTVCLDTNIFTIDTQAVDNFKAHATATVTNNQLIGLLIEYQNFKPEKWKVLSKTVTVEKKQALIKVFPELYARATFNAVTATGGGAGGGASFVVKDKHMIGLDAGANFSIGQPVSGEVLLRYGVKIHIR